MAHSVLSRYLDPEVLSRMADRHIEPRGLVVGNLAGRTSRRCPASPSSSPAIANTSGATIPSTSTGASTSRATNTSSSSTRWRRISSAIWCWTSAPRCATAKRREQKLLYAAQMATTLGYSIVHQSDKVSLATFDERIRGLRPAEQLDGPDRADDRTTSTRSSRSRKRGMAECLTELVGRMKRREIVMVFSDFFTDLDALESRLAADALQPARSGAVPGHAPRRAGVSTLRA